MKNGIAEIDHLLTYVADLDAAAAAYRRLGFTLSPRSHITAMGILNHLVLLHPRTHGAASYIELMAAVERARLPPPMAPILHGEEGIKSMVMMTPDARAAQAELVVNGVPFAPPAHVRREWVIPGEGSVWPEFDVLLPIPAPLAFNACQYHNVGLYLRPEWQAHANGARTLNRVFAAADDPLLALAYFSSLFGKAPGPLADGGAELSPGRTRLTLYPSAVLAARFGAMAPVTSGAAAYLGYQVGVIDLRATRAALDAGRVDYAQTECGVAVAPRDACGNLIEFTELP